MTKHTIPFSVAPFHQTNWDWRAAGNFIGGGSGAGLLLFAALAGGQWYWLHALIGLALVGGGLTCVWAEIGKPLRAINTFRHPQTSWMTREALVAPFFFAAGLAAALLDLGALAWLATPLGLAESDLPGQRFEGAAAWSAAVLGMVFLYCQARILFASKGIPAWRQPRIVPLVLITGLTEGCGWLALLAALTGGGGLRWLSFALIAMSLMRAWTWKAYLDQLRASGAPARTLQRLARLDALFALAGNGLPVALALVALVAGSVWAAAAAGLIAASAGWWLKFTLVARAAFNQGFALPKLPVRGVGVPGPAVKPGWTEPAADQNPPIQQGESQRRSELRSA